MSTIRAVAKKELRAWFLSPAALLFVASFLLATLFAFFWVEGFFARGLADTRPLFTWLPILLAFLVPALGMRLWAEEERVGTVELLRTLPLRSSRLVAGKLLAGLGLVAVALALTLPVPFTVAALGDLDWGPVFGGYLASLLLAGAYLTITLCIYAATSSAIVALIFGSVACFGLYAIGSDPVAGFFGHRTGEILRELGAGGRFDSVLRGVLDARDLLWFASLIGFFLALNITMIEARRWGGSEDRRSARFNARLSLGLLAANLVALNVGVAPVRGMRIDLTQQHEYSISPVTRELLSGLDEPLLIRGYFSEKTHPLLAPLVPRVRDMIEEYGALGPNVRVEIVDPTQDEDVEKEAGQQWGIRPVPFQFADRHESSVVNSYFNILIRYGDQFEVLGFDDLIEVQRSGDGVEVGLRNLEYDLTRTIQKVVYGFQSVESLFARLPEQATLTAYVSDPSHLPEGFEDVPARIQTVADELVKRSSGRLVFHAIDPDAEGDDVTRESLNEAYGLRPLTASLMSQDSFYLDLVLQVGDHVERIVPQEALTEADIKKDIVAALKRVGPGALKTVGFFQGTPEPPPPQFQGMPTPPKLSFQALRETLSQDWQVKDVDLKNGEVDGDVDTLLVVDPRDLDPAQVVAIDQFLMRGGAVVVLGGSRVLDAQAMGGGIGITKVDSGLKDWLEKEGIEVGDGIVLDEQDSAFPVPVNRDLGGFTVREMQMLRYPAFPDVRGAQLDKEHPAVASLPGLVLHWASPLTLTEGDGLPERTVLARSSDRSWVTETFTPQPDFDTYPELGWAEGKDLGSHPLAAAAVGPFSSGVEAAAEEDGISGGHLEASPEQARLAVVGSASFVSDSVLQMGRSMNDAWMGNVQLIQNLVDWSLEDADLLTIRSRGAGARVLAPSSPERKNALEWANYGFALLSVLVLGWASRRRRRLVRPMILDPRPTAEKGA